MRVTQNWRLAVLPGKLVVLPEFVRKEKTSPTSHSTQPYATKLMSTEVELLSRLPTAMSRTVDPLRLKPIPAVLSELELLSWITKLPEKL